jgi:hypothetical protein
MMQVCYAPQEYPPFTRKRRIFLVGPTPRSDAVPSWRPEALKILEELEFDGVVFVPEPENGEWPSHYFDQIEWELGALNSCVEYPRGCIAAWVPRDMKTMPALTTNVEFGLFVKSGRLLYGRPDEAPSTRYLDALYEKYAEGRLARTLESLLAYAVEMTDK